MNGEALKRQHLHFDCVSGAAGDMLLGALIDLGVPVSVIESALDQVGVGAQRLSAEPVLKSGVRAINVQVSAEVDTLDKGHHHHRHHHYRDIEANIRASRLEPDVSALVLEIFSSIARAEAKLHGTSLADVVFHELGAVDALVDIVGVAAALRWLEPISTTTSTVAMGHGTVSCEHGILPVPSPAAVEILREAKGLMTDGGVARELCTPTGAAILAKAVTQWGSIPTMTPVAIGYGAGDADLADRPNVLRAMVGSCAARQTSGLYCLEANIDDMSAELCSHAGQQLFAAGAVDVWWTPIVMKKSRPALQLSVLVPVTLVSSITQVIVQETSSIGVRGYPVSRTELERAHVVVHTRFGDIPVKEARLAGAVVNVAPEFEASQMAARRCGVPLKQVFAAATAAYETRGEDGSS